MTRNRFMVVDNYLLDPRKPYPQAFNLNAVDTLIPITSGSHKGMTRIKLRSGADLIVNASLEQVIQDCQQ